MTTTTTSEDNILIDTLTFSPPLPMEFDKVIGIFSSDHSQSCCESHELCLDEAAAPFETAKEFISKVDSIEIKGTPGMGIVLRLIDGSKEFGIFVPGRGYNNGYYGSNIDLIVNLPDGSTKTYDCSEFQDYEE